VKILILHNRYRQPGGEDAVFRAEARLLASYGHSVETLEVDNEIQGSNRLIGAAQLAAGTVWSWTSHARVADMCYRHQPDIVHVHNFWMRLSPSIHAACREMGVPSVQTLHNYRLLCTGASLLRDGKVCEDCVGKTPWRGVARRCYQGSLPASLAVSAMATFHRMRGTWKKDASAFIALSSSARNKFIGGGLPASRVFVKPNFLFDHGEPRTRPSSSKTVLFVGRLAAEKGVSTLIDAWKGMPEDFQLRIIGDGPERFSLESQAARLGLNVKFEGHVEPASARGAMHESRCVVAPGIWQEPFGMTVIESFAAGRPVIASRLGAPAETIDHGRSGLLAIPGNASDLKCHLHTLLEDGAAADRMGANARHEYRTKYSPERNYSQLISIYEYVIATAGRMKTRIYTNAENLVHKDVNAN
jgi:glycosyltransferase involved in cell wall biosynthesis